MCGVRMVPVDPGEPVFDLVGDPHMRRRFARHLAERDVRLLDVEAVWIRPDTDLDSLIPALEVTAELGAQYLLTVGYDHERARLVDRLGRFADLADEYGLTLPIEFITYSAITNLADAVDVIGAVGRENLAVLVDFLQFFRAGQSGMCWRPSRRRCCRMHRSVTALQRHRPPSRHCAMRHEEPG